MVKISEATKELGLKKQELLDKVYEVTGKKYSSNTSQIADTVYEQVKNNFADGNNNSNKDSNEEKVKTDENIFGEEDSFLSELGFGSESTDAKEEEQEDITEKQENQEDKKDDVISDFLTTTKDQGPAVTKKEPGTQSQDTLEKPKVKKQGGKQKKKQQFEDKKSGTQGGDKKSQKSKDQGKQEQQNNAPSKKKDEEKKVSSTLKKKEEITMEENISIKEFAEKAGLPLNEVMKKLIANQVILPVTASIDYDTATLIGEEFGVKVKKETSNVGAEQMLTGDIQSIIEEDKHCEDPANRAPIVTVMGHVDHGKTKLLDYLRKTNVTGGESGGITQSIGASQIEHNGNKITFIDTPGHELFTSLRSRGSKITDVVIIVVAADDGIKQQTVEAINHAKEANVPILVAVTKIDLPGANLELIKGKLAEYSLTPEDRGGETVVTPLSAVTGEGVNDLMDMIELQSQVMDLRYDPHRKGIGVVIEANKDPKEGIKTSIIVMSGKMNIKDVVIVGEHHSKIKKMINRKGESVKEATGGDPIQFLGLQEMPEPGKLVEVAKSEKDAKEKVSIIKEKQESINQENSMKNVMEQISQGDNVSLKLILKADTIGSMEAAKNAISQIELPENVETKIIHNNIGIVSDSDIELAHASNAVIIGFNVGASGQTKKKAENKKVEVHKFDIIYELIDYVDRLVKGMVKEEEKEVYIGAMEVLGIFFKKGNEMIIGGKVTDGKINNGTYLKAYRNEENIATGKITSLKRETENVSEVQKGHECGMKIKTTGKIEVGDTVHFYNKE